MTKTAGGDNKDGGSPTIDHGSIAKRSEFLAMFHSGTGSVKVSSFKVADVYL